MKKETYIESALSGRGMVIIGIIGFSLGVWFWFEPYNAIWSGIYANITNPYAGPPILDFVIDVGIQLGLPVLKFLIGVAICGFIGGWVFRVLLRVFPGIKPMVIRHAPEPKEDEK